MILLIDAVKTLITSDDDTSPSSWGLNKELADWLAGSGHMVVVVTNAWGDNAKKIRDLLADYSFEFHSLDNNPPKTEPEYRAHVLVYYGFDVEGCLVIDHKPENLDAAAQVGIHGELFVDTKQAIQLLSSL